VADVNAHTGMDLWAQSYNGATPELIKTIKAGIARGLSADDAVSRAFELHNMPERMEDWTWDGITKSLSAASAYGVAFDVAAPEFRRWYYKQHWPGLGGNLSSAIWESSKKAQRAISETIKRQLNLENGWQKIGLEIDRLGVGKVELPKYMVRVREIGRRMVAGETLTKADYRALDVASRRIDKLAASGAPTLHLKKAYRNLVTVVREQRTKAFDRAVARAVARKGRYYAERVAANEIARAYGQGQWWVFEQDEDATGYRSELSSRHPVVDICDYHAGANMYGMGPGVYPKGKGPAYPYHPKCGCILTPYYGDKPDSRRMDKDKGRTFIQRQTAESRRKLLGVEGAQKFAQRPDKWDKYLRNWNGHEQHEIRIPKKYVKPVER
jgi:hypothetical protein